MKTFSSVLILTLALIAFDCRSQTYQLTDLGAWVGTNSYAQGVNNQSQVVGYWNTPAGAHAFLYQAGAVTDLGLLGIVATNSYALSINNQGQVVGFSETTNGSRAFLYRDGSLTNLGAWQGLNSYAYGISGDGHIIGYVDTPAGARASLYSNGNVVGLGTLGGTNSMAFGVNDALQVVGASLTASNAMTHAFLWQNGSMLDLNQFLPFNSGWELVEARGINESGQIVGWGQINNQERAFFYASGNVADLGLLSGGTNSYAFGMNNSNSIVGTASSTSGEHAFLWQNGFINDLNNLINPGSGWELREAWGINDSGQIVGWGVMGGQAHAFLLTPPSTTGPTGGKPLVSQAQPLDIIPLAGSPPTVSITNPVYNATFAAPTNITINATASDSDGTVTQVQFLVGTRLLGIKTNSPYSVIWSNAPVGIHALIAIATDNTGLTGTSSVVNVSISTNLLPIADAHVRDGSSTNLNFGTNIVMECLTTTTNGNNRDIYFKFDLSNVSSNISSAKLSVFAKLGGTGSVSNTVYSVTNTSWLETNITWNNKPARVTALTTNSITGTNWYLFDVSSYVKSQKNAGSNIVSLALHDPTNYSLLISINSKENTTNKPSLVIVTTNSPLSVSITNPINNALFAAPANITINASVSDSDGTVTQIQFFQGTNSLGMVTSVPYNLTWTNVVAGTYTLTARASDSSGLVSTSSVVSVVVDIPPSISIQPTNQTVGQGSNAVFTVTAAGTAPLSYRWLFKGTNFLAGATNASLTLTNVQLTNMGNYSVVVTNVVGSVTSSNAGLMVLMPPVITQQPTNQTVNQGSNATFSVTVSSNSTPPLSYQWRFNTTNLLAGATNASLTLTNVQTTNAGNFSVVVTNLMGSLTSSNAVLNVAGPSLILSTGDLNCIVGSPPKIIDTNATVVNSTNCSGFNGCRLVVSLVTNAQPEDVLAINNQGASTNQIGITNNLVKYWGTNIATFSGGRGTNALVVNFITNASPTVTTGMVQALVRDIAYHYYPSTNDFLGARTVQFVLSNCQGNTNFPASKNITLDCPWYLNMMLVIDCSGTMTNTLGGTTNKLDAARAAAISFITEDMQFPADHVGLVTFTNLAVNDSGLTNNPSSVISKINNLKGGGYTDIGDGIATAQGDFPTNAVNTNTLAVMILLTDGMPNYPTGTNATNYAILKASLAKQAGIRLITIGLGTNGDFDPVLLTTLASSPDDFIYASNTTALLPIYHSIGCSLCRPPTNQLLTVQITSPTNYQVFVTSPLNIPLTAATTDYSGTVTNVQFFNGTSLLGNVTVATNNTWTLLWTNVVAGNYTLTAKAFDNAGNTATNSVSITVNAMPPIITQQPLNVTTNVGGMATFSVTVSNISTTPLSYQWYFNSGVQTNATNAVLTLANVQPGQAGNYWVVVTNVAGSVPSSNALLTVLVPPVITGQPTNQTVCAGSSVGFCVTATGSSLNYQWLFNGTNISGATGSCYTMTNVQPNQAGSYSVVLSNSCGWTSSTNAVLTVNVAPVITGQPTNQTVCAGSSAGFCVTATGSSLNYQWLFNGTNISGAMGSCYTLTNVQANQAGSYSVVVSNSCGWTNSTNAVLTVNVPPIITQQPVNVTTNAGGSATFSVTATGTPPPSYQWRKNGSSLTNGAKVSGANSSTLTLTNVNSWDAGIYTVVVSNIVGSANSSYAVLRVWTPSSIVAWGYDGNGETDVPVGLTNAVAIAAGEDHSLALRSDGTVVAWGADWYGETDIPAGLTNVVAVAAGDYHSLALKADGTVMAWGYYVDGQTDVPADLTNVVAVAGGNSHSLALKSDGMVIAWGGYEGQGETDVPADLTNVVAIAGGDNYSLALKGNGTVVAWGADEDGETDVPAGLTNVVAVAGGEYHSLALKANGTVVGWGVDWYGETDIPAGLTNVVAVAGDGFHSLALKADGTVVAWGDDEYGQTDIPAGLTNVVAVAAGGYHSLALGHLRPRITTQPASQTAPVGSNVTFSVTAVGTVPLSYQWRFNGTNIGVTGSCCTLTNVQANQAGSYSVVVTNAFGSVLSSNAVLTVNNPTPVLTVSFLNPTYNQLFITSPLNIALAATTSDSGGTVTNVQFFNGTNLLGNGTVTNGNTWNLLWSYVLAGNYTLTVKAFDNAGNTATNFVNFTVNAMPVVSILSPTNMQSFFANTNVTLLVSASDADGTIANVQLYAPTNGYFTNLIGTATPAGTNYSLIWSNLPVGVYAVIAVATDNRGASQPSPIRMFTVNPTNPPPVVTITSPADYATFNAWPEVTITANACSSLGIAQVAFYNGTNYLGTDTTSDVTGSSTNFEITLHGLQPGNYSFTAITTDTASPSNSTTSLPINITVQNSPTIPDAGYWDPVFGSFYGDLSGGIWSIPITFALQFDSQGNLFVGKNTGWDAGGDENEFFLRSDCSWTEIFMFQYCTKALLSRGTNIYFGGEGNGDVAVWNGIIPDENLTPVGDGLNPDWDPPCVTPFPRRAQALHVFDGDLYVGGDFIGTGSPVNYNIQYIAKLVGNSNNWNAVGTSLLNGNVRAIADFNNTLYIGGDFTAAGTNTAVQYLARLVNGDWQPVGSGVNARVCALTAQNGWLFVGGEFTVAGGLTNASLIACWDGTNWSSINNGLNNGVVPTNSCDVTNRVSAIAARGNEIYVTGHFGTAWNGSNPVAANNVARAFWNGTTQNWQWSALGSGLSNYGSPYANGYAILTRDLDTPGSYEVVVGGDFGMAGGTLSWTVARWIVGQSDCPTNGPDVQISYPTLNNPELYCDGIGYLWFDAVAYTTGTNTITKVDFYVDGVLLTNGTGYYLGNNEYEFDTSQEDCPFHLAPGVNLFPGQHIVQAIAYDSAGLSEISFPTPFIYTTPFTSGSGPTANPNNYYFISTNVAFNVPLNVLTNDMTNSASTSPLRIVTLYTNHYYYFNPFGSQKIAHGTFSIASGSTNLIYTISPNSFGMDIASYNVADSTGTNSAIVTVVVQSQPQIQILQPVNGWYVNAGTSFLVSGGTADADTTVNSMQLFVNNAIYGSPLAPDANGNFSLSWRTNTPGTYTFIAQATDQNNVTSLSMPVKINVTPRSGGSGTNQPVAIITSPSPGVSMIGTTPMPNPLIITSASITNLIGSAYDPLSNPVTWQVLLFDSSDPNAAPINVTPGPLTNGFHGGALTNASFGTVDLTAVQNGAYTLTLLVRSVNGVSTATLDISLNSNLKLGAFSFSQQDLVLPVNGIPLTVTRTYNSLNPHSGDFGYGWTYALNDMDVAIDEQRQEWQLGTGPVPVDLEDNGTDSGSSPIVNVRTGGGWDVTLTLPDGRRTTFQASFQPVGYYYYPQWTAAPGVNYALTTTDGSFYDALFGYWNDTYDLAFNNYDISGFLLVDNNSGTQYYLTRGQANYIYYDTTGNGDYVNAQVCGPPKLTKILQRSLASIQIGNSGVTNRDPSGNITRTITFDRDAQGRITGAYDPNAGAGGFPAVKYIYDSNGNLFQVQKLVDRNAATYATDSFGYTNASFPHYITGITNADGTQVAKNFYDDSGKLIAVQDANGNLTQFIHNLTNNMEVVIDQLNYGSTNYYDSRGNVTTTVNALGQTNRFAFDNNNYLLVSVDPLGHTNAYGYDDYGCRIASTNALGQATHFKFDDHGQLLSKTDALMHATSFGYDSGGHRTKVTDALGNPTAFGHDIYGRPSAVTNALNQLRATAGSDNSGNLQFVSQVGGLQMNFGHDLNGNTTNTSFAWVNPVNSQTQTLSTITELDAANRVTRVTDPDGQSRMTIYDPAGRVAQSIDRMGNTNSYIYDALGNVIQTTYADGSVTRNVYDARSQVLYSDDRHLPGTAVNGTHNVYDPLGRVIRSERLANVQIDSGVFISAGAILSASSTAYDAAGRVLATTNALGYITRFEYDAVGRQTAVVDALTNRTDSVYDAGGQLRFTTNVLKQVTEYQYDAKGRRIKTIFPDTSYTTNSYNEIGQLLETKDQMGLATDFEYDNLGRLSAVVKPQVFNPEGGTNANPRYEYDHDSYGNITAIRDPKQRQTKFTYDKFGEPVSRFLPLLQTNYQSYNALGQLDYSVDFKGQSNRFVYDSLGRLVTNFFYAVGASTPSQTNVLEYGPGGQYLRVTRPEGITLLQYNIDGAVTNILSPEGQINYEYDSTMGWLTRAYTTNSDIRYGYDPLGRLKTVTTMKRDGVPLTVPEVTTNTYTKVGSLENIYLPNGARTFYQYDTLNHLTNMVHYNSASQVLAGYQYTVASDGTRLAAIEARRESGGTYSTTQIGWTNDALHRLMREASSSTVTALNFTNSYVYDLAGNRLWKTNFSSTGTQVTGYTYNANDQLLVESTGSTTFTNKYDANGSVTNRSSATETNLYSYNLEGRLATAAINQQQTNRYYYNQSGIRIRIETFGQVNATNILLNDPQNLTGFSQVLEELPALGAAPTATYMVGSQIISQEKGGTTLYLMADGHGSTRLLTDTNGLVQNAFTYDGYGSLVASNAVPQTAYLYSGERFDFDLRQYYLRARYYNPIAGRFGVQDQQDGTLSDSLSLHKYAYCQNDPVDRHDPSGNDGDLISLSFAMSIGVSMDLQYNAAVLHQGYIAAAKVTELGASRESILDAASRNASPDVDVATIIVHGVGPEHINGWSGPFQDKLTAPKNAQVGGEPLNHDFYEFDWGGFSINNSVPLTLYPIKSVHEMALVHLQMEEFLVWMNGYANINIISHSWGTTLTYDLQQTSGIETHNWVTMGSVLKEATPKPVGVKGNWINFSSSHDPAYYAALYPPFPDNLVSLGSLGPNVHSDPNVDFPREYDMHHTGIAEHSAYWDDPQVLNDLRHYLQ